MSLFTRSLRLHTGKAPTQEGGPAPDGPPERTPGGTATDNPDKGETKNESDAHKTEASEADTDKAEASEAQACEADTDKAEANGAGTGEAHTNGDGPNEAVAGGGWREEHPAAVQAIAQVTTVCAAALVLLALLLPNDLARLTPGAFVRIPVEGLLGAALLLMLAPKARRVVAVVVGAGLGLLTILKFLDMGFYSVLDRPFDLVLDWILFDDAQAFLRDSVGPAGAIGAVIGAVVLALALLVLTALAIVRLSSLMVRHRVRATRITLVLGTAWITCAAFGVQIADVRIASRSNIQLMENRAHQVRAGLRDERVFAKEAAADAFDDTPADQLLTGLRGKDVLITFIESYGRSAVEDPGMAPQVDAVLADGTERLRKAGYSSRSAWLTSPVAGAGSWLAHSTFLSGLWIKNQQRYRNLTSTDRMTLTSAFRRTKAWRTVGIVPGVTRAWPEGKFFGLDHIYDSRQLGYKGPKFSWSPVPDQFSLSAFERLEHGEPGRKPMMAEIILTSSHGPWAPLPKMLGWDELGDGTVYDPIEKAGKDPKEVWQDVPQLRTEYRRSIEYSLNNLISYVEKYGTKDTVLVFLGDHQPSPRVTGEAAGRDVPVTIVAHDKDVLDRISGWGWEDGLKPGRKAPVWRMDTFRDRFLTAYGPQPRSAPSASPSKR
ncbi:sulfatase [Streptomyces sp. 7N604]|uniref:sulfatase n=1 Tax=Streptomyces sp. 7N604 TaxID=3457415 RepID=UPI003FD12724